MAHEHTRTPRCYTAEENAESNMPRHYIEPVGGGQAEGNVLKSHMLRIERDEDGELVGRLVPDDDTEGQGRGRS